MDTFKVYQQKKVMSSVTVNLLDPDNHHHPFHPLPKPMLLMTMVI